MNDEHILADRIEGIPHPGETTKLVGHEGSVERFLTVYRTGKLHHAYLLSGPKGIGKTTLALRLASHLFRYPDPAHAGLILDHGGKDADLVESKLAARAHPNLLHLTRPWDHEKKRFKTQLTVDEVRQTIPFFGTSRAESGWRVAIVDSVDDMNEKATNALLKILEEPPEKTVFFVISHAAASVLPTIRSRCQHMALKPLADLDVLNIVDALGLVDGLSETDKSLLGQLSDGSVRAAITLAHADGLELYKTFTALTSDLKNLNWSEIHSLADKVSARNAQDRYRLLIRFAERFMEGKAKGDDGGHSGISVLARWAEVWEKTRNAIRTADAYNLDRKQTVLGLFHEMREAAQG